jgi:CrcB protein
VSPLLLIGVGALGGLGAVARFMVAGAVSARLGRSFPFGILAVNVVGAFLLGLLIGTSPSRDVTLIVGAGALGGFTTFSTWMLDSQHLADRGRVGLATANIAGSLVIGLLAVWLGRSIAG